MPCLEWKSWQTGENNKSVKWEHIQSILVHVYDRMINTVMGCIYNDQRFWSWNHRNRTNHNFIKIVRLSCRLMSCQLHQGLIVGLDQQTGWTKQTCPSFPEKKRTNNILYLELSFFWLLKIVNLYVIHFIKKMDNENWPWILPDGTL